ncbi:MAG: RES family NAD+ phosphorylase [Deltaproteobacteria bacterium]|nr:RES family NAD+ phosphorylase [Deltaproteobacteria bacterium]
MNIPLSRILWKSSFRIIASRYPTIHPFEKISSPEDWEALFEIEAMTNDRLRHAKQEIKYFEESKIPEQENRTYILAPFIHLNPLGSRFSDGSWGVYYAAKFIQTAIAETKYHRENFMRATLEKAMNIEMRVITATIKGLFHDIRNPGSTAKTVLDNESYQASQRLAKHLKAKNSDALLYPSVRDLEHRECAAVFNPQRISHCQIDKHLLYHWDGKCISQVLEIKEI